jgi:hypothetical protein
MTDLPPPSGPPPGWYQDPSRGDGFRWWDGLAWTDQTSPTPPRSQHELGSATEWLGQAVRLALSRAGHFFPMVVLLIVPTTLLNGMSVWYALREAVLVTDAESGTLSLTNPGADGLHYGLLAATSLLLAAATLYLGVAVVRHTQAELEDRSEPWSASMLDGLGRLPRAMAVALVIGLVVVGLYLIMVLTGLALPALLLITLPLWVVGAMLATIRLSLGPVAAALAPPGASALSISWGLTRSRFWALFGRLALLTLISLVLTLIASVAAAPFTALVGGSGANGPEPGSSELRFGDLLGDNPAVFAISQLFSALSNGASAVLWGVGLALVYRNLAGPTDAGDREAETSASTSGGSNDHP